MSILKIIDDHVRAGNAGTGNSISHTNFRLLRENKFQICDKKCSEA